MYHETPDGPSLGQIDACLVLAIEVGDAAARSARPGLFSIVTAGRTYELAASSEESMQRWLEALRQFKLRHRTTAPALAAMGSVKSAPRRGMGSFATTSADQPDSPVTPVTRVKEEPMAGIGSPSMRRKVSTPVEGAAKGSPQATPGDAGGSEEETGGGGGGTGGKSVKRGASLGTPIAADQVWLRSFSCHSGSLSCAI